MCQSGTISDWMLSGLLSKSYFLPREPKLCKGENEPHHLPLRILWRPWYVVWRSCMSLPTTGRHLGSSKDNIYCDFILHHKMTTAQDVDLHMWDLGRNMMISQKNSSPNNKKVLITESHLLGIVCILTCYFLGLGRADE